MRSTLAYVSGYDTFVHAQFFLKLSHYPLSSFGLHIGLVAGILRKTNTVRYLHEHA